MFHKMTDEDWDKVIDVHLQGSYNVCKAAVNHFREQQDGSFVLFTSTSGLIGNVGQANYAAAKMGVVGLSRILAMEGAPKNVRSNTIAPFAWTRMIATIPIKDEASAKRVERMKNMMRADQVAQLAVALASPACKDVNGQIFAARGNEVFLMSQPRPVRGIGKVEGWTPETIAQPLHAGPEAELLRSFADHRHVWLGPDLIKLLPRLRGRSRAQRGGGGSRTSFDLPPPASLRSATSPANGGGVTSFRLAGCRL